MAVDKELSEFVHQALQREVARDEIERILTEAGWSPDRVKAALASYADIEFPIPVPRPRAYVSARDAFLYLILFVALGLSAYYLGSLLFQIINIAFPDPAAPEWSELRRPDRIRWAIAMLVVSFPAYLFLSLRINSEFAKDPEQRASRVRKWLTYLTLFIAALFVIGDLVGLVYQFLKGELTIRIGLQILTVAVIAGVIFAYYLRSVGRDESAA